MAYDPKIEKHGWDVQSATGDISILNWGQFWKCNAGVNEVDLPPINLVNQGCIAIMKTAGVNPITVMPYPGTTINGLSSYTITNLNEPVYFLNDGTNNIIIANNNQLVSFTTLAINGSLPANSQVGINASQPTSLDITGTSTLNASGVQTGINVEETFASTTATSQIGVASKPTFNATTGQTINAYAFDASLKTTGNIGTVSNLVGYYYDGSATPAGTVQHMYGGYFSSPPSGATVSAQAFYADNASLGYPNVNLQGTNNVLIKGGLAVGNNGQNLGGVGGFGLDLWGSFGKNSGLSPTSSRPALSTIAGQYEFRGYDVLSPSNDDGFLRISAGGGTSTSFQSYIDLSGYSTVPDMDRNIVFGAAGSEIARINSNGLGVKAAPASDASLTTDAGSNAYSTRLGGGIVYSASTIKTSTYNVLTTDTIVRCDTTGGAIGINLPSTIPTSGWFVTIIDVGGSAATNTINIFGGGHNIDGASPISLNTAYGAYTILAVPDLSKYVVIYKK